MFGRVFKDIDGLTRDEVHDALGRNVVPVMMDQIKALRYIFKDSHDPDTPRYAGSTIRLDNLSAPMRNYGEGWSDEDHARFKAASCEYKIGYRPNGNKPVSAFLDIQLCLLDEDGWDKPVANIGIDFRKSSDLGVFNLYLENVGIADPQNKEQALAALRVVGKYMDGIDEGRRLDPHAFRQDLIDAGLTAKGPVSRLLSDLHANRPTRLTARQIEEQAGILKRIAHKRHKSPK